MAPEMTSTTVQRRETRWLRCPSVKSVPRTADLSGGKSQSSGRSHQARSPLGTSSDAKAMPATSAPSPRTGRKATGPPPRAGHSKDLSSLCRGAFTCIRTEETGGPGCRPAHSWEPLPHRVVQEPRARLSPARGRPEAPWRSLKLPSSHFPKCQFREMPEITLCVLGAQSP